MQNPYKKYQGAQPSKSTGRKTSAKSPAPLARDQKAQKPGASRASKSSSQTPWLLITFLAFGFSLSLYVSQDPDQILRTLQRVRIGLTGAQAADGEKNSTPPGQKEAKSAASSAPATLQTKDDAGSLTMETSSVYKALQDKQKNIEKKTLELARLEEELQSQKQEIERQLQELAKMRQEISSKIDRRVAADEESVKKLVGVYADMKPQNAALIMSQMDEGLAVQVLSAMKKQNAAAILNFMEPGKAQTLSEQYAGLKK